MEGTVGGIGFYIVGVYLGDEILEMIAVNDDIAHLEESRSREGGQIYGRRH